MNAWVIDGLVVLAYFIVVISIGLYKGRGEKTMDDFAVGNRSIPWWAVLASIMAAEVSAGTFLGTPGEGYGLRNFTYGQLAIGTILARVVVAYLFIGRFYKMRVVSIYEFLETRFGRSTKLASSAVFLVTRALASGSRMFVPAILLVVSWDLIKDVTPNRHETLLLYVGAIGVLVLLTAVYTTFGGIKAVVWTDLLQVTLMFGAMIYAMFTLWHAVGGWEVIKTQVHTAPVDIEKVVSAQAEIRLQQQTLTEPEVLQAARRPESDYFVNYILRELPVGVRGIMAAGLFATAMGSLSTALNALATSFTRDFYMGIFRPQAGQGEQLRAARWSTAGFALLLSLIGVGTAWVKLTHPEVRIIPIVLGSFGYTYGSLLGIFLVGMTTRTRGSCGGNLLAMLVGFVFVAILSDLPNDLAVMAGRRLYTPFAWMPIIEFPWRVMAGTLATFGVAVLFRTEPAKCDEYQAANRE